MTLQYCFFISYTKKKKLKQLIVISMRYWNGKISYNLDVIWLFTSWSLWLVSNGASFREEGWNLNDTVWNIKIIAWTSSFCGKITHPNYSFYEFCKEPISFL